MSDSCCRSVLKSHPRSHTVLLAIQHYPADGPICCSSVDPATVFTTASASASCTRITAFRAKASACPVSLTFKVSHNLAVLEGERTQGAQRYRLLVATAYRASTPNRCVHVTEIFLFLQLLTVTFIIGQHLDGTFMLLQHPTVASMLLERFCYFNTLMFCLLILPSWTTNEHKELSGTGYLLQQHSMLQPNRYVHVAGMILLLQHCTITFMIGHHLNGTFMLLQHLTVAFMMLPCFCYFNMPCNRYINATTPPKSYAHVT